MSREIIRISHHSDNICTIVNRFGEFALVEFESCTYKPKYWFLAHHCGADYYPNPWSAASYYHFHKGNLRCYTCDKDGPSSLVTLLKLMEQDDGIF